MFAEALGLFIFFGGVYVAWCIHPLLCGLIVMVVLIRGK